MLDYMPADPIPAWPKRSRSGGRPISELAAALRNLDGNLYSKASARVRSKTYRNGKPMVCLSCGALTDADGALRCAH